MEKNLLKNSLPRVLVIAGSDSGGGAGVQADIKAIGALGGYAATAITSVTSQNTLGVQDIFDLPLHVVESQIRSVLDDIGADIIKTGMLSNKEVIELVARIIRQSGIKAVIDPVMVAKGGASLLKADAIEALKSKLLPLAFLLTPNIPEAEALCGFSIKNKADMEKAGSFIISKFGCNAVLVKGGHLDGDRLVDVLVQKNNERTMFGMHKQFSFHNFRSARVKTRNTHGTGCSYASAIAVLIAKNLSRPSSGNSSPDAKSGMAVNLEVVVKAAHEYLYNAIVNAPDIGAGNGPINHFWNITSGS